MDKNKSIIHTTIVVIACSLYLALTAFYYYIDRYLTGMVVVLLTLLIPATLITMVIYAVKGLIEIFLNRKNLTLIFCLPTIIVWTTLLYTFFSPWQFNVENFESKVEMTACYEGTQSQSFIKFREDKTFEINSTGVFFASFWKTGQWARSGDTLFLKFDNEKSRLLGDTMVIRNNYLIPVGKIELTDSTKDYRRYYYWGYCKGEN